MKQPFLLVLLLLALLLPGCAAYRPLQIEPIARPGTVIAPKFAESYYYFDRDQNLNFVMRSSTTDPATKKPLEQIATVRVFWRPVGGRTTMENSALNATFRYILMTPDSVGLYEGAGFVRLWGKNGKANLQARIMDGDLRLTESSANYVDTLGRSRIRGNINSEYDDIRAMDMILAAHREFFARSLHSQPASQPATQSATEPATQPTTDAWATPPATIPAQSQP